jgi:hypothetical protein
MAWRARQIAARLILMNLMLTRVVGRVGLCSKLLSGVGEWESVKKGINSELDAVYVHL